MPSRASPKRFTVSLERREYDALRALADAQAPPLTLQYAVRYAVHRLLREHEAGQLSLDLVASPR